MKNPNILLIRELTSLDDTNSVFFQPLLQELENNGFFSNKHFTFVGIYYSAETDTTVIGYPKYMPEYKVGTDSTQIISHVNLICQVVEQAQPYLDKSLFDNSYSFNAYISNSQKQYVNRHDLAVSILRDYMTHGVYYSRIKNTKRNSKGDILWHRTIQSIPPVIDRNVFYLETMNRHNTQDYSQLVTNLHIWIINRCARLLQGIGQFEELELPKVKIEFDDSNLDHYVPYLLSKLTTVFSDREIRLIKALAAWCGQSSFYRNQMGTTTFDRIWEYATKQVFGNIEKTSSGPPSYFINEQEYLARGDAIPDILRVFVHHNSRNGIIGILDAKYYCPQINEERHEIYRVPVNSEIAKQIGYYRYMAQLYPDNNIKFTNAFLFPYLFKDKSTLFKFIGFACPNNQRYDEIDRLLDEITLKKPIEPDVVLLYKLDAEALFKACLNGIKVDDETFYESFVKPFYASVSSG